MLVDVLMVVCAVLLCIPASILLIQVLAACLLNKHFNVQVPSDMRVTVLIPAHNESAGIADTLASVASQMRENDRLLVVADNCTDDTADVARALGAEVIERTDDARRGKGYALDFGIQHLKQAPTDILVIVDADCIVETDALQKLAAYAHQHNKPVQALYLMHAKNKQDLKSSVAEFAWRVKNLVRPLGFAKLSLPCQLMGTGMAFPWQLIANVDLNNGNIVEDMKLGIDFALAGHAPLFYPDAKVTSTFPVASDTQTGQSKRWEHGHLSMILTEAPRLMRKGLRKANLAMVSLGLDLSIPPLALFVLLLVGFALFSAVLFYGLNMAAFAYHLSLINLAIIGVAIVGAWWQFGRAVISLKNMLYIPIYILQKIPNHFSFIFKRQSAWNKTEREQD